jgi:hypothetical protein
VWILAATDPLVVAAFSTVCSAALLLLAWALSRIARLSTDGAVMKQRQDDNDRDHADFENRLRNLERR